MTIKLQGKTIPELKALLLDVERAIKLIEREKRQREAAARRKSTQADEKGEESAESGFLLHQGGSAA